MKIYAEHLEHSALEQFNDAMKQDYVVDGALMPDAHTGYALPIGAVVSTKDKVVPAWVGYDIGCGMSALKLPGITKAKVEANREEIFEGIYTMIPVGFNINETGCNSGLDIYGLTIEGQKIAVKKKWQQSLGSLGGGNHFIEIGFDENDEVWIIIHSGSRGVGHAIGSHYMKLAKALADSSPEALNKIKLDFYAKNGIWKDKNPEGYDKALKKYVKSNLRNSVGKNFEGHYGFDTNSIEGRDYIQDLHWALNFALANRKEMMKRVVAVITKVTDNDFYVSDWSKLINRNHNHAELKNGLWYHRKGATQAEEGMLGVIPGNMLDGSFIVKGKGNPESLYSSSHGAGRVLSRSKAKEEVDLKDFEEVMDGITAKVDTSTIDESPFAYKDIFEVMRLQEDLVEVIAHVKPLINIKG